MSLKGKQNFVIVCSQVLYLFQLFAKAEMSPFTQDLHDHDALAKKDEGANDTDSIVKTV